jgi:hypothetical protein
MSAEFHHRIQQQQTIAVSRKPEGFSATNAGYKSDRRGHAFLGRAFSSLVVAKQKHNCLPNLFVQVDSWWLMFTPRSDSSCYKVRANKESKVH